MDGTVSTDDMTLAVVLILHGYNPVMRKDTNRVVWTIDTHREQVEEEDLHDLLDEYLSGAVRVEPKRFMREVRAVRKEVYRLMDNVNRPRGLELKR